MQRSPRIPAPLGRLEVSPAYGIMGRITYFRISFPDMALFGPRVGHDALFDEVCKYHDIDRKIKALLQTIVKKYQMQQPVQIFIAPDTLVRAQSDPELSAENEELQKLYEDWFTEKSLSGKKRK